MTAEEIREVIKNVQSQHNPNYRHAEVLGILEIAAQLAEFNETFKIVVRDTEDIANLLSHSPSCPCCNCHEEELGGMTN